MDKSKNFARVFTGIFATAIVMILVGFFSFKAIRNHFANKASKQFVTSLSAHLKGNDFQYDKLEITDAENLHAGLNRIYYRAKNLSHPKLGSTEMAELSAKFEDYADGVYRFQDFSILHPKEMRLYGWYMGPD